MKIENDGVTMDAEGSDPSTLVVKLQNGAAPVEYKTVGSQNLKVGANVKAVRLLPEIPASHS